MTARCVVVRPLQVGLACAALAGCLDGGGGDDVPPAEPPSGSAPVGSPSQDAGPPAADARDVDSESDTEEQNTDAGSSTPADTFDAGAPATPQEEPRVRVVSPADGASVTNPVQFTIEGAGITTLRLSADGWPIRTWSPATEGWNTSYTFTGTGYPRAVLLEGLNAQGAPVAVDDLTLVVTDAPAPDDWGAQFADNLISHAADYLEEAWGDISSGTPCVAFFSVGLRRHPDPDRRFPDFYATVTEGPPSEACEIQGRCNLEAHGFSGPHTDASQLRKGDICFTQDVAPFAGELWPDHSYVFVEWQTPGSTDFAWVIDNRQEFGAPYLRNITAPAAAGMDFTPFQYFMRSPYVPAP